MDVEKWKENASFVDSLCLPVYTLSVTDPDGSIQKMQQIEQIASQVERQVMGRLLLLPTLFYPDQQPGIFQQYVEKLFQSFYRTGFSFAITISDQSIPLLHLEEMVHVPIQVDQGLLTEEQIKDSIDQCYQQILHLWVKNTQMENNKR